MSRTCPKTSEKKVRDITLTFKDMSENFRKKRS